MIKDSDGAPTSIALLGALIYGANQESLAGAKGGSAAPRYLPREEKAPVARDPKRSRHAAEHKGRRR